MVDLQSPNILLAADLKTAHGQLESLERSLVDISRSIGAGLSLQDKNMNIIWINDVHQEWFGPLESLQGKKCYEVYEHRDHICHHCPVKKVFDSNQDLCMRIRMGITKDDQKRYFRIFAKPVRTESGEILYVLELAQDITAERKQFRNLKNRLKFIESELSSIGKITEDFVSTFELDKTIKNALSLTKSLLHADGCCLHFINEKKGSVILRSRHIGNCLQDKEHRKLCARFGAAGLMTERPDVEEIVGKYAFLSVPIVFGKDIVGILSVFNKKPYSFNDDEKLLLTTFANQSAIIIGNEKLYRKLHMSYLSTIKALVSTIEAKDPYTKGHSEKVTYYAIRIARALKLKKELRRVLSYCGRLHDIGKIAISDTILNKPSTLTKEEFRQVTIHPVKGADILRHLDFLKDGVVAIRHHHERYDGNGYPDGLKGDSIPLLARILSVADSFDAMTSDRAYRPRMSVEDSVDELKRCSGDQFDPMIINAFLGVLNSADLNTA